ncbi:prolyl-tRNA synthetase associated domain-containing protein [Anaerotignum lactatifermentans]|uniref:Prolyl-tRNA synthetase associated domain-containing protein n=1 Tax=Anaerotignum lactatifermentans TaxID=160404 RepID=A0ABS2GA48_9FIRM|nr:prolyl-tRNA synthetase associated domain-containing protein [Anaerotignum lactatifermentans]MBM6830273.1 prolyl-tRNA synthetase associated domain-containing protein [Anaerotignum lactatifermentans]MBM6878351.1 prolyl-tRNA synthetase associated domain-containing protein [Anaerotignum lactatifermentans]MBM6951506.1 prolyl-tRNA synthetase associated domain-containing protein [Anaerotignum lactatifermentans]
MIGKKEIYELLNDAQIPYESMGHEAVYTMEEMDRLGITKKGTVCKNLFLRDVKGKKHYLVCVPEERKIELKTLHEKIGSTKLSFASAERLEKYLDVQQGCVSPLGVLNDDVRNVTVIFDSVLLGETQVGVHPNDNTATIWISFENLYRLIREHGNEVEIVVF